MSHTQELATIEGHMATTPEGKVKAQVKRLLDTHGVYHFSPNMAGYGRSGVPDIIGCHDGYFLAIECKAGTNKPTALQIRELERIATAGGYAFVINESNVKILEDALIKITERK
jgi:Holliday junction resolvase